jgi:hypothetical protein
VTLLVPRVHAVAPGPGSSVGAEGVVDPGGGSIPRALLRFLPVCYYPKPAHKPHPLVLLGGHAPTGLQRVARYADEWLPHRITPHEVEASRKRLHILAAERGRDPASLTISVFGQPPDTIREQVDAFRNAGAVRVAVWPIHGETAHARGEP